MTTQKPHISLFDKSYNKNKSNQYKLYVELSSNGFKYTILDTENNTFIGIEEYRFSDIYNNYSLVEPLKEIIKSNELYKNEFKAIIIAFVNNRSTLIPNAIYQADKLANYHQFNFSKQEEDQFYSDQLINLSAYNIYSIPDFITTIFNGLRNVQFKHFSSALVESALIDAKREKALSLVNVHVLPSSFQVIVIKNQKLELYNSFNYQSSEDFIYYLLFVLDQLNINNEEATIKLTGEVEKNSVIYTILHKYIQTLNFGNRPENLKFSYIFEETPKHFHHALFNQFLCE
ncbi:MAG: DUF3822 family protein [Vicingaceae bacterium]|nr:DUF3822 family protein [Vicingaceae bacterium]